MKPKAHVSAAKKEVVSDFAKLIKEYPLVAAVNMENLPAKQLQNMREQLRSKVVLRMTKRRLIVKALEAAEKDKPGISQLVPHLKGMPALLFTNDNPFSLFKTLKKNQSKAPIKAGQVAPADIVVPAGPTGFAPGPIIGELGQFGIKSGIDAGKVAIKADATVAKEGDVVSAALAGILTRLGVMPMKVGLDLTAAYEKGEIIGKSVLDIDEDAFKRDLISAASSALNLSYNSGYPTKETITLMLTKAAQNGMGLALDVNFLTKDTTSMVLAKANSHAMGIASTLPEDALDDELRGAKSAAASAAPVETTTASPEKKEEKKPEEAASGLGSLFG